MSIYGKQWGEYPSDSELDIPEVEEELLCACGGKKHHFKHLCTDSCKETTENVKQIEEKVSVESIVEFCINDIMEYVDEFIENEDKCYDYYYVNYGIKPVEWRDEKGKLIGMVYYSNSPETRKLWGDSLTLRCDGDDESDEEYDDGDVADYHRHKDMYNRNF
mgnify:CR=1 FL=1|tara:strand:+ start:1785 stop:2270 length:486 start_codon:yes stop_codon:yes gene_type:complete